MQEGKVVYFEKPGPENTEATLALARERAQALGIKSIVVATTKGETGAKAASYLKGFNVVVVTHSAGFRRPNEQDLTPENQEAIEGAGGIIFTGLHAFGGVGRAVRFKLSTYSMEEIFAHVLRLFGQGTKVAVEIAMMAADAGLVRTDEEVIAVGGTASGADTALVLTPANTQRFFDLRVREVLCKPR